MPVACPLFPEACEHRTVLFPESHALPFSRPPRNLRAMASARLIIEQLCACGITDVVTLPDNASKALLAGLASRPELRVVGVTREGEAWAVASGLWIGGRSPAVVIQNTGFLESGD